jgi:hypothetical protein
MLMALLYADEDRIAAAAPACDQIPLGDAYWREVYSGRLELGPLFETAYVTVNNADLRRRLLLLGINAEIDGRELARELEAKLMPDYLPGRAA